MIESIKSTYENIKALPRKLQVAIKIEKHEQDCLFIFISLKLVIA